MEELATMERNGFVFHVFFSHFSPLWIVSAVQHSWSNKEIWFGAWFSVALDVDKIVPSLRYLSHTYMLAPGGAFVVHMSKMTMNRQPYISKYVTWRKRCHYFGSYPSRASSPQVYIDSHTQLCDDGLWDVILGCLTRHLPLLSAV